MTQYCRTSQIFRHMNLIFCTYFAVFAFCLTLSFGLLKGLPIIKVPSGTVVVTLRLKNVVNHDI